MCAAGKHGMIRGFKDNGDCRDCGALAVAVALPPACDFCGMPWIAHDGPCATLGADNEDLLAMARSERFAHYVR